MTSLFLATIFYAYSPHGWTVDSRRIISVHTDEDGEHETLIANIFDENPYWRANAYLIAGAPDMRDALLDVKRIAGKSGHANTDPYTLLELIADKVQDVLNLPCRERSAV